MHLYRIFERLKNFKLYCKLKNCEFGKYCAKDLGHKIANRTVSMDTSKTVSVSKWPVPTYIKELQQFLY